MPRKYLVAKVASGKKGSKATEKITDIKIAKKRKYRGVRVQKIGPSIGSLKGIVAAYVDVCLQAVYSGAITSTLGVMSSGNYFWLNSLYAPYQSATTHQPYTFDQYADLYSNYIVKGVDIDALFSVGASLTSSTAILMTVTDDTFNPASYTLEDLAERNIATRRLMVPNQAQKIRMYRKNDMHRIFGLTKRQLMDELGEYGAAVTASPTKQAVLNVLCVSNDESDTTSIDFNIKIKYWARFFNPKFLANS